MSRPALPSCLLPALLAAAPGPAGAGEKTFRAGAAVADVSPERFPVIVNAMFEERSADRAADPLGVRSLVLDDGAARVAIAVVDTCMMGRDLCDEAKELAAKETGIPTDRMLVSATHTHSAPSAMACLGSRMDPEYRRLLPPRIARAIGEAAAALEPARVGWTAVRAPGFTHNRRWILRPDRMGTDPFGERTVRANMHPGHENPDAMGPSGPADDELAMLSVVSSEGRPIALLANFSMHYYGSPLLSSDYFGRFCGHLARLAAPGEPPAGTRPFVDIMSQGTSGDLMWMDYSRPRKEIGYDAYALELARIAHEAWRKVEHRPWAELAMGEAKLSLRRRTPGERRLVWARELAAKIGERLPRGLPEIYALEQLYLHDEPRRELKLQALRVGDLGIAAIPCEVFAITGLKLKAMSPLAPTFTIELSNGGEGYIPPPEQHRLGGYTTWPARTAGLEVDAEPKIVEEVLRLLEAVAGKPRREPREDLGPLAKAVLERKPLAFWRLGELGGAAARDASGNGRGAVYDRDFAYYLDGPDPAGFSASHRNPCVHLAGGRLKAHLPGLGDAYAVELWFWNALPADARPVTAYLLSRGKDGAAGTPGDHLGIGGTASSQGRLFVYNGDALGGTLAGKTPIALRTWHRVLIVRDGRKVSVWASSSVAQTLDGAAEPELAGELEPGCPADEPHLSFGARSDGFAPLEGKIDEVAVYGRALTAEEAPGR
ncbi:MAG: hypothetical protein HY721_03050 [Planctomycetes bacterium]|nr:hypothetical protein [Planctomycetota bacterium]